MQQNVWTVVSTSHQEKPTAFRLKLSRPEATADAAGSSESSLQKGEECKGAADQDLFKFSCPVTSCGRKFPSLKSLHGHLRSHPERSYRGSKPPCTTDSEKQRQYQLHQDQDMPKWSMKRKRGSIIIQNNVIDSEMLGAANILVEMRRSSSAGPIDDLKPECQLNPPFYPLKKDSYMCTTCNRSFRTYQALGGHKSSCNKIKMGANIGVEGIDNAGPTTVGGHRCRVCGRVFATGRTLGGHMRGHQPLVVVPLIQVSEGPSDSDGLRDFDLNVEPAALED